MLFIPGLFNARVYREGAAGVRDIVFAFNWTAPFNVRMSADDYRDRGTSTCLRGPTR